MVEQQTSTEFPSKQWDKRSIIAISQNAQKVGSVSYFRKWKARLQYLHPHKIVCVFYIRNFTPLLEISVWPGKKNDISVLLVFPIGSTHCYVQEKIPHKVYHASAPPHTAHRLQGRGLGKIQRLPVYLPFSSVPGLLQAPAVMSAWLCQGVLRRPASASQS